jgi:hypothetical protein
MYALKVKKWDRIAIITSIGGLFRTQRGYMLKEEMNGGIMMRNGKYNS